MANENEPKQNISDAIRDVCNERMKTASKSVRYDDWAHNWGIVFAICLGSIGTSLPLEIVGFGLASKICTGLATAIFAVERSLQFGDRWRFHRRIRNGCRAALLQLSLAEATEDPDLRKLRIEGVVAKVEAILDLDVNIPGSGGNDAGLSTKPHTNDAKK